MKTFAALFIFFFVTNVAADEDIRLRVYNEINQPYEDCKAMLANERYQKEWSTCHSDPTRNKERCAHDAELASHTKFIGAPNPGFECINLKPSKEDFLRRLKEMENNSMLEQSNQRLQYVCFADSTPHLRLVAIEPGR